MADKKHSLKYMLMSSIISLVICIVCLAGLTFAWLTIGTSSTFEISAPQFYAEAVSLSGADINSILPAGSYRISITADGTDNTSGMFIVQNGDRITLSVSDTISVGETTTVDFSLYAPGRIKVVPALSGYSPVTVFGINSVSPSIDAEIQNSNGFMYSCYIGKENGNIWGFELEPNDSYTVNLTANTNSSCYAVIKWNGEEYVVPSLPTVFTLETGFSESGIISPTAFAKLSSTAGDSRLVIELKESDEFYDISIPAIFNGDSIGNAVTAPASDAFLKLGANLIAYDAVQIWDDEAQQLRISIPAAYGFEVADSILVSTNGNTYIAQIGRYQDVYFDTIANQLVIPYDLIGTEFDTIVTADAIEMISASVDTALLRAEIPDYEFISRYSDYVVALDPAGIMFNPDMAVYIDGEEYIVHAGFVDDSEFLFDAPYYNSADCTLVVPASLLHDAHELTLSRYDGVVFDNCIPAVINSDSLAVNRFTDCMLPINMSGLVSIPDQIIVTVGERSYVVSTVFDMNYGSTSTVYYDHINAQIVIPSQLMINATIVRVKTSGEVIVNVTGAQYIVDQNVYNADAPLRITFVIESGFENPDSITVLIDGVYYNVIPGVMADPSGIYFDDSASTLVIPGSTAVAADNITVTYNAVSQQVDDNTPVDNDTPADNDMPVEDEPPVGEETGEPE